jgi:perosamine synthetase
MPVPHHPLFKKYAAATPVADETWQEILTLPLFADMRDDEVDYVVEGLTEFDRRA